MSDSDSSKIFIFKNKGIMRRKKNETNFFSDEETNVQNKNENLNCKYI